MKVIHSFLSLSLLVAAAFVSASEGALSRASSTESLGFGLDSDDENSPLNLLNKSPERYYVPQGIPQENVFSAVTLSSLLVQSTQAKDSAEKLKKGSNQPLVDDSVVLRKKLGIALGAIGAGHLLQQIAPHAIRYSPSVLHTALQVTREYVSPLLVVGGFGLAGFTYHKSRVTAAALAQQIEQSKLRDAGVMNLCERVINLDGNLKETDKDVTALYQHVSTLVEAVKNLQDEETATTGDVQAEINKHYNEHLLPLLEKLQGDEDNLATLKNGIKELTAHVGKQGQGIQELNVLVKELEAKVLGQKKK